MSKQVTIVDYGLGNILSVVRACESENLQVKVVDSAKKIKQSSRIIVPGVGAFPEAMKRLKSSGMDDALREANHREIPILGICLGMQILFNTSMEHEETSGLGFLMGHVVQLPLFAKDGSKMRLPSVGWRKVICNTSPGEFENVVNNLDYYFIHSFYAKSSNLGDVIGYYERGEQKVTALVKRNNIIGAQFHPEKSGETGLDFLRLFLKL